MLKFAQTINNHVIVLPSKAYNFVILLVFFKIFAYNKSVIKKH